MTGDDGLAAVTSALAASVRGPGFELPPLLTRERRLHARAYDLWLSLLGGRPVPQIRELDPRDLADFATGSVLVELAAGDATPPTIHFLGQALVAEAGITAETPRFADVPRGSLLGQLLRRLPSVREHGGPIGFEAEFDGGANLPTSYRGILLPFADADGKIAYVYGVISWKLVATDAVGLDIVAAVDAALAGGVAAPVRPAWHAPSAAGATVSQPLPSVERHLATARTWAALAVTDRIRHATSLVAALGGTYDLLLAADARPERFAAALDEAGLSHLRGTAGALALVFGQELSRIERVRWLAVLAHARRLGLGAGALAPLLERYPGGAIAFAAAERRLRAAARRGDALAMGRERAGAALPLGRIAFHPLDDSFFLLLGRRGRRGTEVVATVPDPAGTLASEALRRLGGR